MSQAGQINPTVGMPDAARVLNEEIASEAVIMPGVHDEKKHGVFENITAASNEKTSDLDRSNSEEGHTPYVYEVANMAHDEKGNLIVETSELAVTVLHVDDLLINPIQIITQVSKVSVLTSSFEIPHYLPGPLEPSLLAGAGLACFGSVLATIYMFKPQSVSVSTIFLALISYILGEGMAVLIPRGGIFKWINPFPFNQKEHVAILIMASSAAGAALCTEVISAQKLYYPSQPNKAVSIFMIFSSQLLGYGFAGLLRKTLVYPKRMLWPGQLPLATLFQTLHRDKKETWLRLRFFYMVAAGIFVWEWIPEYIMPILVGVNIFCLAKRDSLVFTNLFGGAGGNEGLGMFSWCFDWQYIGSGCLYYPPATLRTGFTGYILCICLSMGLYYSNVWHAQNFPFLSQLLFTSQSNSTYFDQYNQTLILDSKSQLDQASLDNYGLPWFTATYASSLLTNNLATTATITYMVLNQYEDLNILFKEFGRDFAQTLLKPSTWHWKFWDGKQEKPNKDDPDLDPHYKLMLEYDEVPSWWYVCVLVFSFVVGMICIYEAHSTLPWYAYIVSVLLSFVFTLFMGIQLACFGMYVGQQNLIQMIGAFINPGRPLANMYFTLFGSNSVTQALALLNDLKLGQYMKLSPKATFTMQVIGTLIGAVLNFALMESITDSRREILLSIEGTNIWSGQVIQSYNSQAIAWGALAKDLFVAGGRYQWVTMAFLVGFLVPLPQYIAGKIWPKVNWNYINAPILCWYLGYLCVGINSSVLPYFSIALFTQYYVRTYHAHWYMKYNYVLSAALDGGTQICVFILSFAVFGSAGVEHPFPPYWGNNFGGSHVDYCMVNPA